MEYHGSYRPKNTVTSVKTEIWDFFNTGLETEFVFERPGIFSD